MPDTADKPVGLLIVDWNVKIRLLGVLAISNGDVRCGHSGVGDPTGVLDVDEVGVRSGNQGHCLHAIAVRLINRSNAAKTSTRGADKTALLGFLQANLVSQQVPVVRHLTPAQHHTYKVLLRFDLNAFRISIKSHLRFG